MEIIVLLILIGINGIFALSEMAFISCEKDNIEGYVNKGNRSAKSIIKLMETPDRFLSSIQVGITLIGIISGAFSGISVSDDLASLIKQYTNLYGYADQLSIIVVVTSVTYFSIVFGELIPKSIALNDPEKTLLLFFPFIKAFSIIFYPFVSLLSHSTRFFLKFTGIKIKSIDSEDPIEEILGNVKTATLKKMIDKEQEKIVVSAISMKNMLARDIMVKNSEMIILRSSMSISEALVEAHVHHHTRYPLTSSAERKDIIGYVNFKDIINVLRLNPENATLAGIRRPIMAVNEAERVTDLLKRLTRNHQHIAIVLDKNSKTVGMITLENILGIFVGDLKDEYDILPDFVYNISEKRYLAGGGIIISELEKTIGEIPLEMELKSLTLSDWISRQKTSVKVEDSILFGGFNFIIRKMSRSKLFEIIIDKKK